MTCSKNSLLLPSLLKAFGKLRQQQRGKVSVPETPSLWIIVFSSEPASALTAVDLQVPGASEGHPGADGSALLLLVNPILLLVLKCLGVLGS